MFLPHLQLAETVFDLFPTPPLAHTFTPTLFDAILSCSGLFRPPSAPLEVVLDQIGMLFSSIFTLAVYLHSSSIHAARQSTLPVYLHSSTYCPFLRLWTDLSLRVRQEADGGGRGAGSSGALRRQGGRRFLGGRGRSKGRHGRSYAVTVVVDADPSHMSGNSRGYHYVCRYMMPR